MLEAQREGHMLLFKGRMMIGFTTFRQVDFLLIPGKFLYVMGKDGLHETWKGTSDHKGFIKPST